MAGYYQFGPDPATVPPDFLACLQGAPTSACDGVVGSVFSGAGYCAVDPYKTSTYCACVNSALPCPAVTSTVCTSSPHAYHATSMVAGAVEFENCLVTPICLNVVAVGGTQNVVEASQSCGPGETLANAARARPAYAAAFVVLLVALLLAVATRPERDSRDSRGVSGGGDSRDSGVRCARGFEWA